MVTLPLEKMATRVAGSLCVATGLGDEMIVNRYAFCLLWQDHKVGVGHAVFPFAVNLTLCFSLIILCYNSMKEYEERAVSLALNPQKLQALTSKLKSVRLSCPLFDTLRWVS